MKNFPFWRFCCVAVATFGLVACSSTESSSDADDEDGLDTTVPIIRQSSDSVDESESSSSSEPLPERCYSLSSLPAPTNLGVVKNGSNRWVLYWNYSQVESRPDVGFVVESLDMSAEAPKWNQAGTTNAGVTMFNLVGESNAGKYYQVYAKDECGESKRSEQLQLINSSVVSDVSAELAVPTDLKLDSLGSNSWLLSWSFEDNANRPENGFKLQSLDLNVASPQWTDDGTTSKGVHVAKIDGSKKGGLIFHVAAKDADGISAYSSEIRIPAAVDSAAIVQSEELALAVPGNLALDSMGNNLWKLRWSYTDNAKRPENGFVIEALKLDTSEVRWRVVDTVYQGVHYDLIDANDLGGQYVKVAAIDKLGKSSYSNEVIVPRAVSEQSGSETGADTLATPSGLRLDSLGDNKWQLSWNYVNNKYRHENGFEIQSLDPENPAWIPLNTVASGVHVIVLGADSLGGRFVRVAATDGKDPRGSFSQEIKVPKYVDYSDGSVAGVTPLSVPSGLALDSIGQNKWRLSWQYTNAAGRPENGFTVERLDLSVSNASWSSETVIAKGVHFYTIDNTSGTYDNVYFRVAAKDADGQSEFSTEIQVPAFKDYAVAPTEVEMAVPTNLKLDSIGENRWRLTWSYTNVAERPENGFVVETYDLVTSDAEWVPVKTVSKGVRFYTFEVSATDKLSIIHVYAKDASGGVSAYSDGVQIPPYRDYDVPPAVVTMAVPTGLKLDSIGVGLFQLTWNYVDNKDRPENGFVVESMKPGDDQWTNAATTNKGVHVVVIDAAANSNENAGKFYRVAAKDGNGELSDFSSDIQVPLLTEDGTSYSSTDTTTLAVPTGLAVEDLGSNRYRISWSYANNKNRPETKGFVLQRLDASKSSPEWEDVGSTNTGVHFFTVQVASGDNAMLYHVAAKDSRGLSEYSSSIAVPKYSEHAPEDGCSGEFVKPTGLVPMRIAPNVWRIEWDYVQNPKCLEEKFIIQKVDVSDENNKWVMLGTVPRNVHYFNLEGLENLDYYYRVAAIRGDDTTAYSNEAMLTRSTAYSSEYPFKSPTVSLKPTYHKSPENVDLTVIITGNYPNHAMLNSDYTDMFQYQFRFAGQVESDWQTVDVSNGGAFVTTYTKEGMDKDEFCKTYVSVRTIWIQTDESKDYTEWTNPTGPLYGDVGTTFVTGVDDDGNDVSTDICKE